MKFIGECFMIKKKNLIVKSNEIIEASYNLSLIEQRLILICISGINSLEKISEKKLYTVDATLYAKIFGLDKLSVYSQIKKASQTIFERSIMIKDENEIDGFLITRWVQTVKYNPQGGEISFRFAHDLIPFLSELKTNFTKYYLSDVCGMKSKYSIRIYEILIQWKSKQRVEISIEDFKEKLCLQKKYKRFDDLCKLVLEPAKKDINNVSNYLVTYKPKKTGRKITSIIFTFTRKPVNPATLPNPANAQAADSKPEHKSITVQEFCRANPEKTKGLTFGKVEELMGN